MLKRSKKVKETWVCENPMIFQEERVGLVEMFGIEPRRSLGVARDGDPIP